MNPKAVLASVLFSLSTLLIAVAPAFSAEKVIRQNRHFIHTIGPVTQSLYGRRAFTKRVAAWIRRNPGGVPGSLCDDLVPVDPTGLIKVGCKAFVARKDTILRAADSNQCVKVRFPHGATPLVSAVTVDNFRYCK
ncbi:hypothetical protein [Phormidesmis priestleyi]|uniref:hypothetical protein n=1 Tax=Phormidesmis priestleyi TaxID=268141 RepID=UPI000AFFDF2E|nr:hypothetical protein [Phormidesmis priestleyi]